MKAIIFGSLFLLFAVSTSAEEGFIAVRNQGFYLVKFQVVYKLSGSVTLARSGSFFKGTSKTIILPQNAKQIYLKVEEDFKLKSVTIFTAFFDKPVKKYYETTGSLFNPTYVEHTPTISKNNSTAIPDELSADSKAIMNEYHDQLKARVSKTSQN